MRLPINPLTEEEPVPEEDLPEPALVLSAVPPVPDLLTLKHQEVLVPASHVTALNGEVSQQTQKVLQQMHEVDAMCKQHGCALPVSSWLLGDPW